MYKIVSIVDLNSAEKFIETDKLIEISDDLSKMDVGENDYAHKNQTYLTSCIDTADSALNSYIAAISYITSTYLTKPLSDIYMPEKSLINIESFDKVMNSDAFLTKAGCEQIKTECISYINELKNKATSLMMGKLNSSFISQNSVGRKAFGQATKSGLPFKYQKDIIVIEDFTASSNDEKFDFSGLGEFSLGRLLYDNDYEQIEDYWWDYNSAEHTYPGRLVVNESGTGGTTLTFSSVSSWIKDIKSSGILTINPKSKSVTDFNPQIEVPKTSYDYVKNQSIPMAQIVETFLKIQIKTVIKKVCDRYLAKMTSIPSN